ncbi:MAG: hypothetical protein AB2A00_29145 [Myxococcota bacterium]
MARTFITGERQEATLCFHAGAPSVSFRAAGDFQVGERYHLRVDFPDSGLAAELHFRLLAEDAQGATEELARCRLSPDADGGCNATLPRDAARLILEAADPDATSPRVVHLGFLVALMLDPATR